MDGNIEEAAQFHDAETDSFHMRLQFTSHVEHEPLRVKLAAFMEEW